MYLPCSRGPISLVCVCHRRYAVNTNTCLCGKRLLLAATPLLSKARAAIKLANFLCIPQEFNIVAAGLMQLWGGNSRLGRGKRARDVTSTDNCYRARQAVSSPLWQEGLKFFLPFSISCSSHHDAVDPGARRNRCSSVFSHSSERLHSVATVLQEQQGARTGGSEPTERTAISRGNK